MKQVIKEETKKIIQDLAKKYRIKVVMIFGSVARKKTQNKSDIDLAILADDDFYKNYFSDFSYDLLRAEEAEKREIDVVPIGNHNPILLFNIFNDGVLIYAEDKEEYQRLRGWARFSYEDNRRFFFGREKLLQKRLEELKKRTGSYL